jgi:hypothetical protein
MSAVLVAQFIVAVLPTCTPFAYNAPFLNPTLPPTVGQVTATLKVSNLTLSPEAVNIKLPNNALLAVFTMSPDGEVVAFWTVTVPEAMVSVPAEAGKLPPFTVANMFALYCESTMFKSEATLKEKAKFLFEPPITLANTLISLVPVFIDKGEEVKSKVT